MTSNLKNKLNRFGFTTKEVEAFDILLDLIQDIKLLNDNDIRDKKIENLIRQKYSLSQELSIIRKAINDKDYVEFKEFDEYVNQCIKEIKDND